MPLKQTIITLLTLVIIMLAGCRIVEEPIALEAGPQTRPVPAAAGDESIQNRFTDNQNDQTDAVKSALMWSQKYEELSVKTEKLREANDNLALENTDLKHKLSELDAELERTKKELAEANDFLQQMQIELTKWKSDVLGFRDEMRSAQAAQLEALQRVLRILGAEPVESTELQTDQTTDNNAD
jgi:chromosome segregation ATPase